MKQIFATHITLPEGLIKRQIANRALKAMVGIETFASLDYLCNSNIDDD